MAHATAGARDGSAPADRASLLRRGLGLEWFTVGWNLVEAAVALAAAVLAGSVALLGFGIDSVVESASAGVIVWRLMAERRARDEDHVEAIEQRARKLVALSLALLALYVAYESVTALVARERPEPSFIGIGLAVASLLVMYWLWRAKRAVAIKLGSRSMQADAFQTNACFWLSLILLVGIGLNAAFGWWWADPLAALAMVVPIGLEAKEAWEGEED